MAPIQQMVHRAWLFLVIAVLLLSFPLYVTAEIPGAEEIFEKLIQSSRTVDFQGRLTLVAQIPRGNPVSEARVIRKAPDKQRIEFTWPSEMRGMGMVINGEERWSIRSDRERGGRPFLAPPPNRMMDDFPLKNIQRLLRNYDVRILDGGSIADRSTYLLEIDPRVAGKPSRKIWVDAEMSVILKVEYYDSQKRLRGFYSYSNIDFEPEIDEAVFRKRRGKGNGKSQRPGRSREELWNANQGKLDLGKIRKAVRLNVIVPDQLAAGFALQSIQALSFGERKNVHLRYTDGLAVLSVFQSLSEGGGRGGRRGGRGEGRSQRPSGSQRQGRPSGADAATKKINIYGVVCEMMSTGPMVILRWNYKTVFFTLMGELEQKQMTEIVGSFISKGDD